MTARAGAVYYLRAFAAPVPVVALLAIASNRSKAAAKVVVLGSTFIVCLNDFRLIAAGTEYFVNDECSPGRYGPLFHHPGRIVYQHAGAILRHLDLIAPRVATESVVGTSAKVYFAPSTTW